MFKHRFNQNGFTIIELVVTLAIFGIMLAIALPSFLSYLPTMRLKGAARDISSTLQSARMEAVSQNRDCNVSFDINNKSYIVSNPCTNITTTLPTDISFGWGTNVNKNVSGEALPSDGVAFLNDTCYFTSRGTVNSGSIYIKNTKNESYAVVISSGGRVDIRRWDGTTWVQ
ncbi:MAG: GspH/FimT family pseudopilin [Nitrospinota bacterium]